MYFSSLSSLCDPATCTSATVVAPALTNVAVNVFNRLGQPVDGAFVLAYIGAAYTGFYAATNASGLATLSLPQGSYRFEAVLPGKVLSSSTCAVPTCTAVDIRQANVTVSVANGSAPQAGVVVYAFSGAFSENLTYSGHSASTNAQGQAVFGLPQGSYWFLYRQGGMAMEGLGQPADCAVPGCSTQTLSIAR